MKIVIVGGGSAGWMTAATLVKAYPEWDITLYEDERTPTVGVGESTTQFFAKWIHFLDVKDEEWMPACDATYKISVRFCDFHKKGDDPWQYPFALPREVGLPDQWWYNADKYGWKYGQFARDFFIAAECAERNKLPVNRPEFDLKVHSGYQMDAVKFAAWLRDDYCKPRGVKHKIERVDPDNLPEADLYFDCTGFACLLDKSEWLDYSDFLPNNHAWVTRIGYQDMENQMVPYTNCTALDNGWVWNVPLIHRMGTGYVFSDKFTTPEKARDEFRKYLEENVESDVGAYTDKMFRLLKYKCGRKKEPWNGKVISIGLSSGFIEPVESNGLLSVHQMLLLFLRVMKDRTVITQFMRDTFNNRSNNAFDGFTSFVALHYAMTQRDDTDYWKHVGTIRYPYEQLTSTVQETYLAESANFSNWTWDEQAMWCVMAGHGWNPFNKVIHSEIDYFGGLDGDEPPKPPAWQGLDSLPSPYQYYKENLYAN